MGWRRSASGGPSRRQSAILGTMGAARITGTLAIAAAALSLSCSRVGMVDDGTSVSWSRTNGGKLLHPVKLPASGDGYVIPARWAKRGLNYGTDEMVSLVVYLGRELKRAYPEAVMGVADISYPNGGPSEWHSSHQGGRDVDLLMFATTMDGKAVNPTKMRYFNDRGETYMGTPKLRFDVARTWRMVRDALTNPIARVHYMFIYDPLKQMLLDYAQRIGESPALIEYASYVLHQPSDSARHDDHIHLRIYCSPDDVQRGCIDRGDFRWAKKLAKYTVAPVVKTPRVPELPPLPPPVALALPLR